MALIRPPIVSLKYDFLDQHPPAIAMAFMAGGDLLQYVNGHQQREVCPATKPSRCS